MSTASEENDCGCNEIFAASKPRVAHCNRFLPSQLAALAGNRGLGLQESKQLNVITNCFKLTLVKNIKLECELTQK